MMGPAPADPRSPGRAGGSGPGWTPPPGSASCPRARPPGARPRASAWSILIVRCGRSPFALASRRCGNGGGGSQFVTRPRSSAGIRRRMRRCTACLLMPSASASGRSGQPASLSPASVADSRSLRPDERSSRSRAAIRSGSGGGSGRRIASPSAVGSGWSPPRVSTACTYWRRPWVTTSDMVRPSRARRALRRCRCSWSSRKVSSRLFALIPPRPAPRPPRQRPARQRPARQPPPRRLTRHRPASSARPRPAPGSAASRPRACAGSSPAAGP